MSTVSTPEFDFIFKESNKLTSRIESLNYRIDRAEFKLDKYEALLDRDVLTGRQLRQVERKAGRLEGLIEARTSWRDTLIEDLAELDVASLPQDEIVITYDRERGERRNTTVFFQESPYDDLIEAGELVTVGVRAWSDGRSYGSRQLSLNHPDYNGDKYVLGDSTFTYANITVRDKVFGYENAEVFVEAGGEVVFTQQLI